VSARASYLWRLAAIAALVSGCTAFAGDRPVEHLTPLPPGMTLPVLLAKTLNRKHIQPGQTIVVRLYQRVPLGGGRYLPDKTKIVGVVSGYDGQSLALSFTQLRLGHETEPVSVKLVAVGQWIDVDDTKLPEAATDRSTSNPGDWTTVQIGRDAIYRSGGSGPVFNQYSEPVGSADFSGVYAAPASPGAVPRAMGPFSTTAAGLYDVPGLAIALPGASGRPIVFRVASDKWELHSGDALLLEVIE
jgi:hypothetical protein